jgi:PAS domain S-box-containing protein
MSMKRHTILLVDDEELMLRLLEVTFSEGNYRVLTASSGPQALALLEQEPVSLILSDNLMPGMNGVELLSQVRRRWPECGRILMTGFANLEVVLASINEGQVHRFLAKPLHPDQLLRTVEEMIERLDLMSENQRLSELTARQNEELRQLNAELEGRVRERTAELSLKNAELEALGDKLLDLYHNAPDGYYSFTPDGLIVEINQTQLQRLGYSSAEVLGRMRASQLLTAGEAARFPELLAGLAAKGEFSVESEQMRRDGTAIPVRLTARAVYDEAGNLAICHATVRDISAEKHLAAQLIQAQKLESIGQLAAGIAHEINTPTQYVGDNTRFLQDAFGDLSRLLEKYHQLLEAGCAGAITPGLVGEVRALEEEVDADYLVQEIPKAVRQSLEGIGRIAKIVQSMKDFAHPGQTEKQAADLNKAIESTITVARNEWKYVAEMRTDFDTALPPVPCLLSEFNQVVLNMIINAAHAIAGVVGDGAEGKGTITISTRHAGDWAEVRIGDTGTGIPEQVRSRIFDPFFTTKEVGKGTGQGLAISHSVVVEKHGGTIHFETEVGRGTTFIIRLPTGAAPLSCWKEA